MKMIVAIMVFIIMVFSILSFVLRKPGPKGDRGERGRDGYLCDDLTAERIISLLNECNEIDLHNSSLRVRSIKKPITKNERA